MERFRRRFVKSLWGLIVQSVEHGAHNVAADVALHIAGSICGASRSLQASNCKTLCYSAVSPQLPSSVECVVHARAPSKALFCHMCHHQLSVLCMLQAAAAGFHRLCGPAAADACAEAVPEAVHHHQPAQAGSPHGH